VNSHPYPHILYQIVFVAVIVLTLAMSGSAGSKETVIYSFPGGNFQPCCPVEGVISDSAGNLYGTASGNNANGNAFELSPPAEPGGAWTLSTFCQCLASGTALVLDKAGRLYGVTGGTVFQMIPPGGRRLKWTTNDLWSSGLFELNSPLFLDGGNLYGTAIWGGNTAVCLGIGPQTSGCGFVFELERQAGGTWTENTLYSFGSFAGDGEHPNADLVFRDGVIYGTTSGGGSAGSGTFFQLAENNGVWTESILYNFSYIDDTSPSALIADPAGNFFGTRLGGQISDGTIYELSPPASSGGDWQETTLYNFQGKGDGANPSGTLWRDAQDDLYGTTWGGAAGCGSAFKLKAPAAPGDPWTLVVLHDFGKSGSGDGCGPYGGLTFHNGTFYGATAGGGDASAGTVFSLVP
jgi:hypothetical protein